MHRALLDLVIAKVRRRYEQGDCPSEAPDSVETLENAILALAASPDVGARPIAAEGRYSVAGSVYEAAVKGRQDFRNAYRALLPIQRAAAALCLLWRSPQHPFQVSDSFADAVNALDVAVSGGHKDRVSRPILEGIALSTPQTEPTIPAGKEG